MEPPARPDLAAIARESGLPWLEAALDMRFGDDYFGYAIAAAFLLRSLPTCEPIVMWTRGLSVGDGREIEGAAIASLDRIEEEIRYVLSYRADLAGLVKLLEVNGGGERLRAALERSSRARPWLDTETRLCDQALEHLACPE